MFIVRNVLLVLTALLALTGIVSAESRCTSIAMPLNTVHGLDVIYTCVFLGDVNPDTRQDYYFLIVNTSGESWQVNQIEPGPNEHWENKCECYDEGSYKECRDYRRVVDGSGSETWVADGICIWQPTSPQDPTLICVDKTPQNPSCF